MTVILNPSKINFVGIKYQDQNKNHKFIIEFYKDKFITYINFRVKLISCGGIFIEDQYKFTMRSVSMDNYFRNVSQKQSTHLITH